MLLLLHKGRRNADRKCDAGVQKGEGELRANTLGSHRNNEAMRQIVLQTINITSNADVVVCCRGMVPRLHRYVRERGEERELLANMSQTLSLQIRGALWYGLFTS